ncbi:MAG: hypothetical protein AAGA30_18805, partial [Planctomycetota bacterium]
MFKKLILAVSIHCCFGFSFSTAQHKLVLRSLEVIEAKKIRLGSETISIDEGRYLGWDEVLTITNLDDV